MDGTAALSSASALSSPAFRKYLCGNLVAYIGFRMQSMALAILVFRTTGSALDLGIVSAIAAVPAALFTILGGVLADRCDTRLVWAANAGISAAVVGLLGWMVFNDTVSIGQTYALAAIMGVAAGVHASLGQAYFPSLVPENALKSGVTFNTMSISMSSIIGPTVAGLVIAAVDLHAAFALAALCWSMPVLIVSALPARNTDPLKRSRTLDDFRFGLDFILQNRLFLVLVTLSVANYLLVFGWLHTLPAFIDLFGGGEHEVGYAFTAAGIGATVGVLLAGRLKPGRYMGHQILAASTLFSATVVVLSFAPSFYLVPLLAFFAHAGNGLFSASGNIVLQSRTPEPVRGRVMGAIAVAFNLSSFSGMWTGAAITLVGDVRLGMAVGPLIMLGIILLFLATQRRIRTLTEV